MDEDKDCFIPFISNDELAISNVRDTNYCHYGWGVGIPRPIIPRRVFEGCRHGCWGLLLVEDGCLVSRNLRWIHLI